MVRYGRSSANGCGVNDGIHRDTGVCDKKNNGGGFDPPRWASTRSSAHAPTSTSTSTWTSTREPIRDPFFSRPATPTRAISARSPAACFNGRIIRCLLHAPSTVRPLARDPRVLVCWPLPLGFGLGGRLLLTRRERVYLCLIHHHPSSAACFMWPSTPALRSFAAFGAQPPPPPVPTARLLDDKIAFFECLALGAFRDARWCVVRRVPGILPWGYVTNSIVGIREGAHPLGLTRNNAPFS